MDTNSQQSFIQIDIESGLLAFHRNRHNLPGIASDDGLKRVTSLMTSAVNSFRALTETEGCLLGVDVADPSEIDFNPMAAAAWYHFRQETDEACWLLFLRSYIGRHVKQNWNLLRAIYGGSTDGKEWTWKQVSKDGEIFRDWLLHHQDGLAKNGSMGEAHKYVAFTSEKASKMGRDIQSYIRWVKSEGSHQELLTKSVNISKEQPAVAFHHLYQSMIEQVKVKKSINFNYLSLIGAIGLARVEPEKPYLNDLLFSKIGARWLFGSDKTNKIPTNELNDMVISLARHLEIPFGIPVLHQVFEQVARVEHAKDIQKFKWRFNR